MPNSKERLLNLMRELKLNNTEFAKKIKTTPQALTNYLNDSREIGRKFVGRIITYLPDVNLNYLLFGELPILKKSIPDDLNYLVQENTLLKREIDLLKDKIRLLESKLLETKT